MNDVIKHKIKHNTQRFITSMKWIVFSILSGLIIGGIGSAFYGCIKMVTELRMEHLWLLYLLPLGGIVIVGLYRLLKDENDTGTNLVLSAIHSNEEIPLRMAPLIFISTVITHLFGGSAGREGAALQIGGSIGGALGRLFRFNEKDKHIMIMCGMSAAFTALFGTPMAAAVFSIEVVSVGIMHYSALVPCVISALVAKGTACYYGCLLLRPHKVLKFDRLEDPQSMDKIMSILGANPIDWAFKTECCGAGLSVSRTDLVGRLSGNILKDASDRGAEAVIVACPMCHSNLDMRRSTINRHLMEPITIPVLYVTQVLGLAIGLSAKDLGLKRHFVGVNLKEAELCQE